MKCVWCGKKLQDPADYLIFKHRQTDYALCSKECLGKIVAHIPRVARTEKVIKFVLIIYMPIASILLFNERFPGGAEGFLGGSCLFLAGILLFYGQPHLVPRMRKITIKWAKRIIRLGALLLAADGIFMILTW